MSINSLQKQTNINIQEKANLIWEIATHLVGLFKPHEYGKVILPMTVLKRFDDALASTKQKVVEMGEKLGDKAPKIFNVNWFKQDEEGNFLWPGFGDNMRVLDWIIKRCEGTVDAVETAIGYLPKKEDLNLTGIEDEVTPAVLDKLLDVDTDLWKKEIAEMRRYYTEDIAAKGGKVPAELMDELDKIEARLNK